MFFNNKVIPWLSQVQNWLLPGACVLCSCNLNRPVDLCEACESELPWLSSACMCCAQPFSLKDSENQICGACVQTPPFFNRTISMFCYQEPIKKLIAGVKFQQKLIYTKLLGELFAKQLSVVYRKENLPECIIPVPLHPKRLRERGYNQALELARPIAKALNIKLDYQSCERVLATQPQTELPASQRYVNVKQAFILKATLRFKHVAVLDDVVTTGHTVNELSKILSSAGVEKIDVWCCARTDLKQLRGFN